MMKRTSFRLSLLLLGVAFSCAQPEKPLKVSPVELSAYEENLQLQFSRHAISSDDPALEKQCLHFSEHVSNYISRLRDSLVRELPPLDSALLADTSILRPTYEFHVTDTVFRATDRYISLRVTVYSYSGGAHGMTRFYAFNYDTREQKFIDNALLLDYTRKAEVEKLLKTHLDNKHGCFTQSPTLTTSTVINFAADNLIFTYPPYDLGPYVCGSAEIVIPLKELGKSVKLPL